MCLATNSVGDGHSGIRIWADPQIGFHAYPIRLGVYEDGVYVEAALSKDIVGGRLVRIESTDAAAALAAVAALIPRDNDQDIKTFGPSLLVMAEVLDALGIAGSADAATFHFEVNGREISRNLVPGDAFLLTGHSYLDTRADAGGWVDARRAAAPLLYRDPHRQFWMEYLDDSRTLYAQINEIQDDEDESLEHFASRLREFAESNDIDRLVIDLRWNRGGNNYLNRGLIPDIILMDDINERGNLFVIIGNRTFSAAQSLVNEMEKYTDVVFVGEPTAQSPNHYGDNKKIILSNSGIKLRASYLYWEHMDPRDTRRWTAPDVAVSYTFADYVAGHDPVFDAILSFDPTPLLDRTIAAFDNEGEAATRNLLVEYETDPIRRYEDIENTLNMLGYEAFMAERPDVGLVALTVNTELFPESWNVWDSLGEAYMYIGERDLAIENYKKSLEINPENNNARDYLAKLQAAD